MNNIPSSLIKAIESNNIVPIVGAGVSQSIQDKEKNSVFPSWKSLLEKAVARLKDEAKEDDAFLVEAFLRKNDYGKAAKYAHEGLKGSNWTNFFKDLFDPDLNNLDENSASLPKAVWELSDQIITLNYDKILQWAHRDSTQVSTIDKNSVAELANFQKTTIKPMVWHLHGQIDNSAELILSPDDYDKLYPTNDNAKVSYEAALEALKTVSTNRNLLFIGCNLDDAELLSVIHKQQKTFAGNTGPHYALVLKGNYDEIEAKLNGTNIQLIAFDDFGEPLIGLINDISQSRQKDISKSNPAPSEKIKEDVPATKIALLSANPLNQEQDYSDLMRQIKKIKCPINHFSLSIDNLNYLRGYEHIIILSKVTKNRILIEDEYLCSQRISFKELEDNIDNHIMASVYIFVDKLPDEEHLLDLKQPTLIIPGIEKKKQKDITFQLFKKLNLNHFNNIFKINPDIFQPIESGSNSKPITRLKTNLPNDIDPKTIQSFIGRSSDLEQISRKLVSLEYDGGFLTIKGSGGIGKTTTIKKIAVALAKRSMFSGGIFFVDCEFIPDSNQFEYKVASAFNLEQAEDKQEHLKNHHDDKARLIILDNVETLLHLKKEDTQEIKDFLTFICDYATVVATSRELLKIDGESIYDMRPFTSDEAVELFLSLYNRKLVNEDEMILLRRDILENLLDNNPLAIKLITANMPRGKSLSVLKEELETDLFSKITDTDLELFDAQSDFNIERKKSIYGSILYSYRHLTEGEAQAFELLSLFPDGIDLESFKRLTQKQMKAVNSSGFKQTIITDRVIKLLENKSMLENNGGDIKLQSIVGKFAEVQLKKRENLYHFYKSALQYNISLMNSLNHLKVRNEQLALDIFDNLKGNFFNSIRYSKGTDARNDDLLDYFDDIADFSIKTSSINTVIDDLSLTIPRFKEGKEGKCIESIILYLKYYNGDFEKSYRSLKNKFPLSALFNYDYEDKIERIIYDSARNIYEMEGERHIDFLAYRIKNKLRPNFYPVSLYQLGILSLDLLNTYKRSFYTHLEVLYSLDLLNLTDVDIFLNSIYEKHHIEIAQVSYLRSKIEPLEKNKIEKLVNVNSYVRGLKKLMLAFIEKKPSVANNLYQKAIEDLEHIKYYFIEAQYFHAKFLQKNEPSEFDNVYQKGLALTKKHHYRYLQYCFEKLLTPTMKTYDAENYPLPDNVELVKYINFLIKDNQKG